MNIRFSLMVSAAALLAGAASAQAQTEIQWWHAMTGANNEVVETLAREFNESQSEYRVVPVFKGTYPETLNAGIAAFRARQPPHIIQVFDVGTGVMMNAEGAVKPVAEVMEEAGYAFDKSRYLPGIVAYYSTPDGTMLSFPYNSSSPILYYNRAAFEQAGLDPDSPPETCPTSSTPRVRSRRAAGPAALPRPGRPGSGSRRSVPGTTCPMPPSRTAWAAPMSSC